MHPNGVLNEMRVTFTAQIEAIENLIKNRLVPDGQREALAAAAGTIRHARALREQLRRIPSFDEDDSEIAEEEAVRRLINLTGLDLKPASEGKIKP